MIDAYNFLSCILSGEFCTTCHPGSLSAGSASCVRRGEDGCSLSSLEQESRFEWWRIREQQQQQSHSTFSSLTVQVSPAAGASLHPTTTQPTNSCSTIQHPDGAAGRNCWQNHEGENEKGTAVQCAQAYTYCTIHI